MDKKKIDTSSVTNELKNSSVFFYPQSKSRNPSTPTTPKKRGKPQNLSGGKKVKSKRGKTPKRLTSQEAERLGGLEVDVDWTDNPTWKGSHLYTEYERDLFAELELGLRRRYGIEVHKREIARAAIRVLFHDFERNGEHSFLVSLTTNKIKDWLKRLTSQEAERQAS